MVAGATSTPLSDNEFELLAKEINDIEPIALAANWLDDGMRLYFAAGAITYTLHLVKTTLPGQLFSKIFGDVWNFVDSIGGYIIAEAQEQKLKEAKRNITAKKATIIVNRVMSSQSLIATSATTLVHAGLVKGTLASVFSPMAGFAFAAGVWGSFALAVKKFDKALDKSNMAYLANDRLVKYEHVEKKRQLLEKIRDFRKDVTGDLATDPNFISFYQDLKSEEQVVVNDYLQTEMGTLSNKIAELEKTQLRLKNQAVSIYRVNKNETNFSYEDTPLIGDKIIYNAASIKTKLLEIGVAQAELVTPMTNTDLKLNNYLQFKNDSKVSESRMAVAEWGMAAIGMTLIAFAPFLPALAIPGTLLVIAAAMIKISVMISQHLSNSEKVTAFTQQFIAENKNDMKTKIATLNNFIIFKDQNCLR